MEEEAERPMVGKIVLITGANSGIGKATSMGLAQLGATVIMVSRDKAKGEEARNEVMEKNGNKRVDLIVADLASLDVVKRLAKEFKRRYERLHVLINNAGGINSKRTLTKDGYETTLGVNHLAHFLLTNLLLDTLKKSAPSRIINVSSFAHKLGKFDFDDLCVERRYSALGAYSRSKLANVLFTYELARRLEGTNVTANALNPGMVRTRFGRTGSKGMSFAFALLSPFMKSPAKGAETSIYLASSPEVEGVSGKYFVKKRPVESNKLSYNRKMAKRLWEASEKLVAKQMTTKGRTEAKDGP
jgi:NAD(P)-dependent dehydrogenase (short-subunit alcohol dehydrogenase family)